MNEIKEDTELMQFLSSFSCEQDEDIESFLRNRAVEFEKLSKASVSGEQLIKYACDVLV